MIGIPVAVIDACVLVNFSLCDTLLRLAEAPRIYEPKWSEEILNETLRTLEGKLGWPVSLTQYFQSELKNHFAEAWVHGHEPLIPYLKNDQKDRHVLAAAIHSNARFVITFNLRHFRPEHLQFWEVSAIHPDGFLSALYRQRPKLVVEKLRQQAEDRSRSVSQLIGLLSKTAPGFGKLIRDDWSRS